MSNLGYCGLEASISLNRKPLLEVERSLITKYRSPLWSKFVKAINDYHLINEGDKIAVAISGGKDSLLMAKLFQELHRHGKKKFELEFIAMDPGYHENVRQILISNCNYLNISVTYFESDICQVVDKISREYPCYLCARMRRGCLYSKAQELGCNKLALGHHLDDVIETTMLNLFCAGTFKTMQPKLKSTNFPGLELIRPMYCIREDSIIKFMKDNGIVAVDCGCIVAAKKTSSKREEIKELIKNLSSSFQEVEKSIFQAAHNVDLDCIIGWKQEGKKHSFLDEY